MRSLFLILIALACRAGAESAGGALESYQIQQRPKLSWEALKGYRLFFHPEDKEPLRRSLNLIIPTERRVRSAWALVKAYGVSATAEAWLRVEGVPNPEFIAFEWGGIYQKSEFPDQSYLFEVHVRWMDGDALDQELLVVKSALHPVLTKFGASELGAHALSLKRGEYEAGDPVASASLSAMPVIPLVARVYAPPMPELFHAEGIQVSYKFLEDIDGIPPAERQDWHCACQQALPADSPARLKARKVLCEWEASGLEPGLYELRLSLYHRMKHPGQFDRCDVPILDEDRIRVVLNP